MKKIFSGLKFLSSITSGIIFLGSTLIYAVSAEDIQNPNYRRVSFSIGGGYAHSESVGNMVDLNVEIQFSLSSNVRFGFGVGYLNGSDGMHMGGNFNHMQGGMMGDFMGGFTEHNHSLRVIPLTLSLYYVLPVSPKLDMFMFGGGGYYIGSYKDQTSQNESVFGPHIGLGLDWKIAERITIVAEGLYRFANIKGFTSELHEGFREEMEGEHEAGFWHFHHHEEEWHFHEEHENQQEVLMDVPPFDISLNGISLRVGIKFGF
ncbi:MAG: hypothetical protein WBE11_10230 [Candidatus Aminicenantaceae bacterium]